MKTYVRKDASKFIIKKKVLLINLLIATILILILGQSCIKEDYPVRMLFPVLTTTAVTSITSTTASGGGNITYDGGSDIKARGVCWGFEYNPSVANAPDSMTVDGTGSGQFTSSITNLVADTIYHLRAYATNKEVTAYGPDVTFRTPAK
jgi:hypothetical protein